MASPFAFRTLSKGLRTPHSARMFGATARRTAGQQLGRRAYSSAKAGESAKASSDIPWFVLNRQLNLFNLVLGSRDQLSPKPKLKPRPKPN